jgi:uncharacterized protein
MRRLSPTFEIARAGSVAASLAIAALIIAGPSRPAAAQGAPKESSEQAAKPKRHPPFRKPAPAPQTQNSPPTQTANDTSARELDLAFGAYQRGYYLTAFSLATKRIDDKGDPKSMTLLGELYANGYGVPRDDAKAAQWYKFAADRGDANAMFALAIFAIEGRAGPRDREVSAKWLAAAAKLGHAIAAYDLALLYMEGQLFPQDFGRAAELLRVAAQAGNPDAQYALGTLYKQGRGVAKDMHEAAQLWAQAALAENTDAEVEYAIALYNGDGVDKDEAAAAALFRKAAIRGSAIAQDRLARILATGRGAPKNPVEATKWHVISKARGETDLLLDDYVNNLDADSRSAGEKAAKTWLDALKTKSS